MSRVHFPIFLPPAAAGQALLEALLLPNGLAALGQVLLHRAGGPLLRAVLARHQDLCHFLPAALHVDGKRRREKGFTAEVAVHRVPCHGGQGGLAITVRSAEEMGYSGLGKL